MTSVPRLLPRTCSPTLLAELLQACNQTISIQFPKNLPGEAGPRALSRAEHSHLRCGHAFIWWHLQEFGRDDASVDRVLGRYARRHGVAFLITASLLIDARFCINDLTFRRARGRIVSPPLEQFLLDRGVAPPDWQPSRARVA